jgi:Tfp pilus assembly protein PilX
MYKARIQERGVILFIVLATIFVVTLLGTVVVGIISSQSRLTRHKVSRIQAYYAAMAGVNYALEKLRIGEWTYSPTNSCPNATPCTISDTALPSAIQSVKVIFCPSATTCSGMSSACSPPTGLNFCVTTTATYTYTP